MTTRYDALYQRLAQEIIKTESKIGSDAKAFVAAFIDKLKRQGYRIDGDAEAALLEYLSAMQAIIKTAVLHAVAIGLGHELTPVVLRSEPVLALAEQAYTERWPDGLTLSKRLWRWQKSTRDGVSAQLQAGIRQGKATGTVLYDVQRAIEHDTGKRFKLVSDHADQWIEELYHSAQAMIHAPGDRVAWQKIVDDTEARISELSRTGSRHAAERLLAQIRNAVDKGQEQLLDNAVKWWAYDKQLYHLNRIVRTEMANAAHQAVIDSVADDPTIIGFQWRLSGSHPATDICDYYANIEMGLGKGVFSQETVPRHKAHPHCMCVIIPRVTKVKQKGSKNYAQFIQNTSPERREQLLPQWVKKAIADGVPLTRLIRSDGFGLITRAAATDVLNHQTIENIVAKFTEKAKNAADTDALWTNADSLKRHVNTRKAAGHIESAADYREKIVATLHSSKRMAVAVGSQYPLVELRNHDWSVIIDHNGQLKTAYKIEPDKKSFTDNQTLLKHKVYDYPISAGIKQTLASVFGPR